MLALDAFADTLAQLRQRFQPKSFGELLVDFLLELVDVTEKQVSRDALFKEDDD